ncbi:MAG TPA: DoxX family protein [Candidatus Polarisedimenticolia bacterium]|nr:DoxX family protein [Candidatus Polarisedimenticolia bacterium]
MAESVNVDQIRTGRMQGRLHRVLPWLGHVGRIVLGLVFLVAGLTKLVDPAEFGHQLAGYGIIGEQLATLAAPLLIAFETTLGIALLVGYRLRVGVLTASILLVLFIAVEAYGIAAGRTESCGCFGAYLQRTPGEVIVEDLLFLLLGVMAWFALPAWQPRRPRAAAGAVIIAALASVALAAASPHLPIDPYVTRLAVGRPIDTLQLPGDLPSLGEGRHLVALFEVTSPDAIDLAARLSDIATAPGAPGVLALSPSSDEDRTAFFWSAAPEFDVYSVDRPVLKRLYRRLPLFFAVDSGRIVGIGDDAGRVVEDLLSSEGS